MDGGASAMLMHFASAQPAIDVSAGHPPRSPIEPEEITPPSGDRRSPTFSRPTCKLDGAAEREPPSLSRTASEMDGINLLLGLASVKRAKSASTKSTGKRRCPSGRATPAAKRTLQVSDAPNIMTSRCQPLSGAKAEQLKVLAIAFLLCPAPTDAQLNYIAQRADLTPERVTAWFRARGALQGWVREQMQRQPSLPADEIVNLVWRRKAAAIDGQE